MKKRLIDVAAFFLHRPAFWAIGVMVEVWRSQLPEYQRRRYQSDGSPFWAKVCENSRRIIQLWDRSKRNGD